MVTLFIIEAGISGRSALWEMIFLPDFRSTTRIEVLSASTAGEAVKSDTGSALRMRAKESRKIESRNLFIG